MKSSPKRSLSFICIILFFGVILGSILSQFIGALFPDGVVKDFFLTSNSIGWGSSVNNWLDLWVIRIKTGFFVDISVALAFVLYYRSFVLPSTG